jgi:hypothetical protein
MVRTVLFLFVIVIGSVRPAAAVCGSDGQGPCFRYWTVDAVFVATSGARITLFLNTNECVGVSAEDSSEIFVYARRDAKRQLHALGCGQTKLLEEADEDLAYARSTTMGRPAWFMATCSIVKTLPATRAISRQCKACASVFAQVTSRRRLKPTKKATIRSPCLAGKYTIEAIPPDGFADRFDGERTFELPDRRACYKASFQLQQNGRLRGRVINREGEPVKNLMVRAGEHRFAKTDLAGSFELGPLEEGNYTIGAATGSDKKRFVDAPIAHVEAGHATDVPPLVADETKDLVTLVISVAGRRADAGPLYLLVTVGSEELGGPIRVTDQATELLVEKKLSYELLAIEGDQEARLTVQPSLPLTEITLTLRPQK